MDSPGADTIKTEVEDDKNIEFIEINPQNEHEDDVLKVEFFEENADISKKPVRHRISKKNQFFESIVSKPDTGKIELIKGIYIPHKKPPFDKIKYCSWTKPVNCKRRTSMPCMNEKCQKNACELHSTRLGS